MSSTIRDIMIRTQLFVNYLILHQTASGNALHNKVFSQNFWYSVSQLVIGKAITNQNSIIPGLLDLWTNFSNAKIENTRIPSGYSQCLSAACVEASTSYSNYVVERFEGVVKKYLFRSCKELLPELENLFLNEIVHQYCHQQVCGGTPEWPNDTNVTEDQKGGIDRMCDELLSINILRPVNETKLSGDLGAYIIIMRLILSEYERAHQEHQASHLTGGEDIQEDDQVNLPRLFVLFPVPSLKWRFTTIDATNISSLSGVK